MGREVIPSQYRGVVKRIALTGGIGAGKSTVVEYLREMGLMAVDADEIYSTLVAPGESLLGNLVDAFGSAILKTDGSLDRGFLASVVFHDATALRRLNAVTHPAVGQKIREYLDEATGSVAFCAIPLLRREHRHDLNLDEVWSVQVEPDTAVQRLVHGRNMSERDARTRIANQVDNAARQSLADVVITNESDLTSLRRQVDDLLKVLG